MKDTKFRWVCVHCGIRSLTTIKFQFDVPKQYTADWKCPKCGKITIIGIELTTKAPIPKLRDI